MAFEETADVILRTGVINMARAHFVRCFEQLVQTAGESSVEIHRSNLHRFWNHWSIIQSDNTCFGCLRRITEYGLHRNHSICETCVILFGERHPDDQWIFKHDHCILCGAETPKEITVKVHPPTAGVGVLCLDGGGARGITTLQMLKRIQDRMGLPIPPQRFFKAVFAVSSGKSDIISVTSADH